MIGVDLFAADTQVNVRRSGFLGLRGDIQVNVNSPAVNRSLWLRSKLQPQAEAARTGAVAFCNRQYQLQLRAAPKAIVVPQYSSFSYSEPVAN